MLCNKNGAEAMAVDPRALELKLIRRADGVELDLLPLQGLWTEARVIAHKISGTY